MAGFILLNCWGGLKRALALVRMEKLPRHRDYACPACGAAPLAGEFWLCGRCDKTFDTFTTGAACPHCRERFGVTRCADCGALRPFGEWAVLSSRPTDA
jgi:DNA-directed RNA polymerase subunit RPC12/RpoP